MRVSIAKNNEAVSPTFLQSRFWAEFKATAEWSFVRYDVIVEGYEGFALSVLERGLGAGLRFAYVPHGPRVPSPTLERCELLAAIAEALRPLVSERVAFIRFDPAWYEAETPSCIASDAEPAGAEPSAIVEAPSRPSFEAPLRKASDVQPPDSVVLAVDRPDDEILAGMKPKWRYNIRLAAKKGVTVASEGVSALDEFYALYRTTAERDRIGIHPRSYYERLLCLGSGNPAEPGPDIRLWVARYEGRAIAAIITVFYGTEATYLYGASGDEHRNAMPAYALQWAAIRAARDAGCLSYDFYGIPPVDDPDHAMSGLYRFKTGFGGEVRHYSGAWDYVLKPLRYAAFRSAERARLFWHKTVRKKLGRKER